MFSFLTNLMPGGALGKIAAYAVAAVALFGGGFWAGHKVTSNAWQADVATQQQTAATQLAAATARADAADLKAAQFNTQVEAANARRIQDLAAKDSDMQRTAAELDRLRQSAGSGSGGHCAVPRRPVAAAQRVRSAPDVGGPTPESFERLAAIAASAIDLARRGETCHQWATGVSK